MKIKIPRGTQDILPDKVKTWQFIEERLKEVSKKYHYQEIRTPIFEHTEVFSRSVGETTDIVQKEMYTFQDRGGRDLTLRPEGTAAVVRSYVENKMYGSPSQPVKLYYIGPMFRYERPQSGRYREFVQFGAEALGSNDPAIDVEIIAFAMEVYRSVGLKDLQLVINSLGDPESRSEYRHALMKHFKPGISEFCNDCQSRLEKNPLRILDCKVDREHELMESAPSILDYLNDDSKAYFEKVLNYLDELNISYTIDPSLVRGLDYYNHTTFEIMSTKEGFGAITTLCGGGRYNGLVEEFGGPDIPGIGFALSIERLITAMEAESIQIELNQSLDVFVASLGEAAKDYSVRLLRDLREAGIFAEKDYMDRKIKGQLKEADRLKSKFVIIIGDDELKENKANVKNMATGEQFEADLPNLIPFMDQMLEDYRRK